MKRRILVALGVLAIPMCVLGYGYWFARSHGSLFVSVTDVSDRERPRALSPVALTLLEADGRALAEARTIDPVGAVYLTSPAEYSCWDVERRAPFSVEARHEWDQCFARQSRWIPTWIRRVTAVDLRAAPCLLQRIPVSVSEYPDTWWLWWVPLPHVGGKPYTSFNLSISIDLGRCAVST